jgi:hypothetical protein
MIQTTAPQPENAQSAVILKVPTPVKRPAKKAKNPLYLLLAGQKSRG